MCTASGCLYILVRGKRGRRKTPKSGRRPAPVCLARHGNSIKRGLSDRCILGCFACFIPRCPSCSSFALSRAYRDIYIL